MKKLIILSAVLILAAAFSAPASAVYQVNWSDGFETATVGNPLPAPWTLVSNPAYYTTEVPILGGNSQVHTGSMAAEQQGVYPASALSASYIDLRVLPACVYYRGYAKGWIYDNGYDPNQGRTDARIQVMSSVGPNLGDSIGKTFSAQIQDATTRDPLYWYAQWTYAAVKLDGGVTPPPTGAGFLFTPGLAALRQVGWNYVLINWVFTYTNPLDPNSGGTGMIQWRINQTGINPNLTLNFDSSSTRWGDSHEVAGMVLGSLYPSSRVSPYDDLEFHADAVPEPSSLLAFGTGLIGLVGLIRRRR